MPRRLCATCASTAIWADFRGNPRGNFWRQKAGLIGHWHRGPQGFIRAARTTRARSPMKTVANFDRIGEENAFAVLARATALAAQGRDIINLGIGQPDFRTPEHIVEAAIKALQDGHHGYTPGDRHPAAARGGGRRSAQALWRHRLARRSHDHAGRQAHHVHVHPDVRRAGRGDHVSRSRLSHLSLHDRIYRRHPGADPDPRRERLCLLRRGDAGR